MNYRYYKHSQSGFSILMAMGVTGILLIIVTSLALAYIREGRLSRFSYDEVLSSTAAEGSFEYGMLKMRNHKDGFQDIVSSTEPDGNILSLSTPRSQGLHTEYRIIASSSDHSFTIGAGQHLIIPLFSSNETFITPGGVQSKNPNYNTGTDNTTDPITTGIGNLSWTIVAMSGSSSTALTGSGDINNSKGGIIRVQARQCYDKNGNLGTHPTDMDTFGNCSGIYSNSQSGETIDYSYDEPETISHFLSSKQDPYFILHNATSANITVGITSTKPFSLPTSTLTATAKKGESSQVYQFAEDKGKYYDALKYGIYNTVP